MKTDDDRLHRILSGLPAPSLPPTLRRRTLALACAQLAPSSEAAPRKLGSALPAYATSAALLSADAVFVADACLSISRAFGS